MIIKYLLADIALDSFFQISAPLIASLPETFDSSVGGIGGCPYLPLAAGNISTEDLVHGFEEMKKMMKQMTGMTQGKGKKKMRLPGLDSLFKQKNNLVKKKHFTNLQDIDNIISCVKLIRRCY